jgi:peptide/nickel transport system substrate-binding protein
MDTGPLTYAFHLRQGIMWTGNQNIGMLAREFTSSDVVFSLKRSQTSPISAGSLSFINKITIVDKYTVSVEMNAANPNWVQLFGGGLPQGAIVAPESVAAGADDWRNAVGTGPFILKDYVDGASATYRKNPAYWEKLSFPGQDRQLPFIDEVTLIVVPDAKEQFAATITGKIDWNPNVNQVDSDMLSKTTPDLIQQKYLNGNAEAFKINRLNSKYLADKNVRRALMIGTDLKTINQAFNNTVRVNNAFWPPAYGIPGLTALDSLPVSQQELWVYNTGTAKKLIAAAGYPNGFTIEIDVDSAHQKEASLCQNLWAGIGVNSTIKIMDSDALLNADNGVKYPDVIFSSYNFNNPFTLFSRLQSNAVGSTYKSSEPFDTMYNSILVTNDPVKRAALEQQLGLAYMDDVGMIPIVCSYSTDCYFPWLKYYYGEMETGYHNLTPVIARMWIDQNLKTAMMNRGLW